MKLILLLLLFGFTSNNYASTFNNLTGKNVLIVYKKEDTLSKAIAVYYSKKRNIHSNQLIAVDLGDDDNISVETFKKIRQEINKKVTPDIHIVVFTWHAPYRVKCMSLTSAFTLGYDTKFCGNNVSRPSGCHPTALNPYFNKSNSDLWHGKKPPVLSMMLSGKNIEEAKKLIDRGIRADYSKPTGKAYLVNTNDPYRSTRSPLFKNFAETFPNLRDITIYYVDESRSKKGTKIKYKKDVMFYFTGYAVVPSIDKNKYLPGAIADHLTSFGGMGLGINDKPTDQMKAYRWLEAGLTASYGTVTEPCNYHEKFPNPAILIPHYLAGDTLIEAYWKSVAQPGEGIFIGEPLASPWKKKQFLGLEW